MEWISVKDRLPEYSGQYKVKNNSQCNNSEGECYYDINNGWDIPDMIKSFYKIYSWKL